MQEQQADTISAAILQTSPNIPAVVALDADTSDAAAAHMKHAANLALAIWAR